MDMLNEGALDIQSMGIQNGKFVFRQGSRYFAVSAKDWKASSIDSEFNRILREKDGFAARNWLNSIRASITPIQVQAQQEQHPEPVQERETVEPQWSRMGNVSSPAKTNKAISKEHNQNAYLEAKQAIEETGRACIVQATGTGKSSILTSLIDDYSDGPCLFVSPTNGVNDQFVGHQEGNDVLANDNLETSMYASICASYANDNPPFFRFQNQIDKPLKMLCLDEMHRAGAKEWGAALDAFIKEFCDEDTVIVGASATPKDSVVKKLFGGKTVSNLTLEDAVARGILPMCTYINVPQVDDKEIKKLYKDAEKLDPDEQGIYLEQLDELVSQISENEQQKRNDYMVQKLREQHPNGKGFKVLGFFGTIKDAQSSDMMINILQQAFPDMKIVASSYTSGDSKDKEKRAFFDRFVSGKKEDQPKDGEILLLSAVDMFNEGIHAEGVETIFMGRNTQTDRVYSQQIGRVLSVQEGQKAYVYDLVNNVSDSQHDWKSIYDAARANGYAEGIDEPYLDTTYENILRQASICYSSHKKGKAKSENGLYRGEWRRMDDVINQLCQEYGRKKKTSSQMKVIRNYIKIQMEKEKKPLNFEEACDSIKNCSFF